MKGGEITITIRNKIKKDEQLLFEKNKRQGWLQGWRKDRKLTKETQTKN